MHNTKHLVLSQSKDHKTCLWAANIKFDQSTMTTEPNDASIKTNNKGEEGRETFPAFMAIKMSTTSGAHHIRRIPFKTYSTS
jgi:hypothetical protein